MSVLCLDNTTLLYVKVNWSLFLLNNNLLEIAISSPLRKASGPTHYIPFSLRKSR